MSVRASERSAALVALYVAWPGPPLWAAIDAVRTIVAPSRMIGMILLVVKKAPRKLRPATVSNASGAVSTIAVAGTSRPGVDEQDVDRTAHRAQRVDECVDVGEVARVPSHARDVRAKRGDGLVDVAAGIVP